MTGPNQLKHSVSPELADRTSCSQGRLPTIAVIVPVRNEEHFIARTLNALVEQDYPADRFEVLVVDGGSSDRTREIAGEYISRRTCVRVLDNPKILSSAARNVGIKASRGEIVLVVDGHCELSDRLYLRKLADAFARSGADCVGRPQPLDVTGATELQKAIAVARKSPLGHNPNSYIYSNHEGFVPAHSVAIAYRRHVFSQVGYFDERFDACEDVELNHRVDGAGLRCYLAPAVALNYVPRKSLRALFRQLFRYARGRVRLLAKHPNTFRVSTFLPGVLVLCMVGGGAVARIGTPWQYAYLAGLAAYISLVLIVSATAARRRLGIPTALLVPVVFITIHLSVGLGVIWELCAAVQQSLIPKHRSP